jgi:replicative DNA helicase
MTDPTNAEHAVVGAAFIDPAVVDELADIVEPTDFSTPQLAEMWAAIVANRDAGRPIDATSLVEAMMVRRDGATPAGCLDWQGLLAFTIDVSESAMTAVNAPHHAAIVAGASQLRKLSAVAVKVAADATRADPRESSAFVDAAIDRITTAFESPTEALEVSGKSALKALNEHVKAISAGTAKPSGPETGLADLDEKIGTMSPRQVWLIGANSGHGKTAFAVHLAQSACRQGFRVLYVSLEISREQIMGRMVAAEGRIPYSLFDRRGVDDRQRDAYTGGMLRVREWVDRLDIWAPPTATVPQVARRVRTARRQGNPYAVVVMDYGQLLRATGRHGNREQAVAEVADAGLEMARSLDVCAVVPLQLNRENDKRPDKRPRITDLRESSRWEHHAHVGLLLYRPQLHDDTQPANVAEIIVAKNRNGPPGTCKVMYEAPENRWANLTAREEFDGR